MKNKTKRIRICLWKQHDIIAGFSVEVYRLFKGTMQQATWVAERLNPNMSPGDTIIDEIDPDAVLFSGNVDRRSGYTIFENITEHELFTLDDGIDRAYARLNPADKTTFDDAVRNGGGLETETLASWSGPSMHF